MSHTIAVDPHRNMAILVMDEPTFAMGPVVVGDDPEEAQEVLQTFVEHLGRAPEQLPTIELMNEWQSFLMAFHGVIQVPQEVADAQAAAESPQQPPGAPEPPAPEGEADPTSGPPADEQVSPATQPAAEDSAGSASPTGGDSTPQTSDPASPDQQCFACGGAGQHVIEGQEYTCQTCGGTGKLPAPVA